MIVQKTKIKDLFLISPKVFKDQRGYFFESFNLQKFKEQTELEINFIQDNQSSSSKGVLRGLHFPKASTCTS